MDQNTFEAVQAGAWVLLFIFALSFALVQYNHINSIIDRFIDANMFGDRGTSTEVYLDSDDIIREADRAEVIMSILNIPDTAAQAGNQEYKVIVKKAGGGVINFSYSGDASGDMVIVDSSGGYSGTYYMHGVSASILSGTSYSPSKLIDHIKTDWISASDKFKVSYNSGEIRYEYNP